MIEVVNTALLDLQGALSGRALYPSGHPTIQRAERAAVELLAPILEERGEISIFQVGGRVVLEDHVLPGSASFSELLFRLLAIGGVDRLTFRQGLRVEEVHDILDDLARCESETLVRLLETEHVRFGFIRQPWTNEDWERLGNAPKDLERALRQVCNEGQFERNDLERIVMSVTRAVASSEEAILPLANVKRHDEYTFVHTINVSILSAALGEAVGFDARTSHDLSMSALLHDVGKQLVPEAILNKKGKLDDAELKIMQGHAAEGARILLGTPNVPPLAPIVAYEHHIRADGKGYPRVPVGWKLNLASRIVQVADVFDALRTNRPYREALPLEKIVDIMQQDVGVFFDAELLDVFLEHVISRPLPPPASG